MAGQPLPASGPIGGGTVVALALAGLGRTPAAVDALRSDAAALCVFNASDPANKVRAAGAEAEAARADAEAKQAEYEQAAASARAVTQAATAGWRREQEGRLLRELGALRKAQMVADGHLEQVRSNVSAAATIAADGASLRCVAPTTLQPGLATVGIAPNANADPDPSPDPDPDPDPSPSPNPSPSPSPSPNPDPSPHPSPNPDPDH